MQLRGARILGESLKKIESSSLSKPAKEILSEALNDKLRDFQKAVQTVLGIYFIARADDATAVPGEQVPVSLSFYNQGAETVVLERRVLTRSRARGL